MGYGSWRRSDFEDYSTRMNRTVDKDGRLKSGSTNQEIFKASKLDPMLDPHGVIRECCDSEQHPETLPVILALDVTGSMGQAAVEVARQLNVIMTRLYDETPDVQFMIMGIGDFAYDRVPLQVSQFEADIRIAEQLDKLYFEFGGGGNNFESYSAAWYFALHHTKLDAWKRRKKGILITMGDERLNPYIPARGRAVSFQGVTGDTCQADLETREIFPLVSEKYELYHLDVDHRRGYDAPGIRNSWKQYLDNDHFRTVTMDTLAEEIVSIVGKGRQTAGRESLFGRLAGGISW